VVSLSLYIAHRSLQLPVRQMSRTPPIGRRAEAPRAAPPVASSHQAEAWDGIPCPSIPGPGSANSRISSSGVADARYGSSSSQPSECEAMVVDLPDSRHRPDWRIFPSDAQPDRPAVSSLRLAALSSTACSTSGPSSPAPPRQRESLPSAQTHFDVKRDHVDPFTDGRRVRCRRPEINPRDRN